MKFSPKFLAGFGDFSYLCSAKHYMTQVIRAMMTPEITSGIIYANLLPRSSIDLTTPIAVATQ